MRAVEPLRLRYRPLKRLQTGGGVTVDLVHDQLLGGVCVLKLGPVDGEAAAALRLESELLGELGHPRLARLIDRFDGVPWSEDQPPQVGLATAWVDGEPLSLAARGLPLAERVGLFWGVLPGVSYLHARGLLHLDLKPPNVLATPEFGAILLDLGGARPVDSGPGEAGGTLGYAAPEVVLGQAASIASDVYSLGALLFEVLAGVPAFPGDDPRALREACLHGEPLPLRAVAPEVPRALAALVADMLAREPGRRPRSVAEVAERLGGAGFPGAMTALGEPPFVGRAAALRGLLDALREPPAALWVCGAPRSGRTRLVRRALAGLVGEGVRVLDLSRAERPVAALHRLLSREVPDLPPHGGLPRTVPVGPWVNPEPRGVVFLGRRGDGRLGEEQTLDALLPLAVRLGWTPVMVGVHWAAGQRAVHVDPLEESALGEIAAFAGVSGMERERVVRRADGLPGLLLRELSGARLDLEAISPDARAAYTVLHTLPDGVPQGVLRGLASGLTPGLRVGLRALQSLGLAWLDREGLLHLEGPPGAGPVHPSVAPALRALLERDPTGDPLWFALAALRLGWPERAQELLPDAAASAGARRAELNELAQALAALRVREAGLLLARIRQGEADYDGVLAALDLVDAPSDDDEVAALRLRVLRTAGRLPQAEAVAQALLARREVAVVRMELAHCLVQRGAFDEADREVERAIALDPSLAQGEGLVVRMILGARRVSRGGRLAGLDGLVEQVRALGEDGRVGAVSLMSAARVVAAVGDPERAQVLLQQAVSCADREGDLRVAAAARLNRGNLLVRLERGREARKAYTESLALARAIRQRPLLLRLSYSLAQLELGAGRGPDAEARVAEFHELAEDSTDPEALRRGQLLDARLHALRADPEAALGVLEAMGEQGLTEDVALDRALVLARVLLDLGQAERAFAVVQTAPNPSTPAQRRALRMLAGRAHLAMGREALNEARALTPVEPDPTQRLEVGELLLTWAGEDQEPSTFGARRLALEQAARLLTGEAASRAATLRDRLLPGPGAALEAVVQLTEAMHDPRDFPAALARLVGQALGAHRVLILLRMPGMGKQMSWQELAGEEAAGIGQEVMRRIQGPDDVWTSDDAFADPALREVSATVRNFRIRSLLAVAIPYAGRAIGALYLDDLHRASRFGPEDVHTLRRLAAAAGRMITLLPTAGRQQTVVEPRSVLGVWLSDSDQLAALEDPLDLLRGQRQTNLLVTGDTGVGKTWFARRVAQEVLGLDDVEELVVRRMDPQMLVSTLTGTRRGEFTGAITQSGAIQRAIASRRALFIDEVQSLDEAGQQILLPLLELPHRRFGGLMSTTHPIDGALHIILGTNEDVSGQRWSRHFRSDLWFRMSQVHVHLPTLAERGPEVVARYLHAMLREEGQDAPERLFEVRALARVTHHLWPGNLRELHSFATRAAHTFRQRGQALGLADLRRLGLDPGEITEDDEDRSELSQAERDLVVQALQRTGWVQADAARALGVSKWKILRLVRKYDLNDLIRRMRGGQDGD